MPYRLDLAALRPHELKRALLPAEYAVARPALAAARLMRRPVFAPDAYPDRVELRIAEESDWDALGASLEHAGAARAARDELNELGFHQVGAFRVEGMPYPRNFFAYLKEADTFGALYLSDAAGPPPYLEYFTLHREPHDGRVGIVTSSASTADPLDPSARFVWQGLPGAGPELLFQLHRGKVIDTPARNRRAATVEDFTSAYLDVWNENYGAWRGRGVLKPAGSAS